MWRRGRGRQPACRRSRDQHPSPATDAQETSPADGTPIRITFGDTELTARLDDNATARDPAAGDLGYWAPSGDLVFYYDSDAPFFNGIVRIGEFDGELDTIERQSEDFTVTIERAEYGVGVKPPIPRPSFR